MCIYSESSLLVSFFLAGPSEHPFPSIPEKEKSAWKLNDTNAYHAPTDASLFSTSLPVLPHVKCEHEQFYY